MFPDNTRKIIFQCDFLGKMIFSEHLEKENIVFRAVNVGGTRCEILLKHVSSSLEESKELNLGLKYSFVKKIKKILQNS